MVDNNIQEQMIAAGFSQTPATPTTFIQTPQQKIVNVEPTTVVSGNNNKIDISSIIQDNAGGLSSIRILMLLWGGGVFLVWLISTIIGMIHGLNTLTTIQQEIVEILVGIIGIKTIQRFGEK